MSVRVLRGRAAGTLADARRGIREQWSTDPATGEPTPERVAMLADRRRVIVAIECAAQRLRASANLTMLALALRRES